MARDSHVEDVRNIAEGDHVSFETTETTLDAECVDYSTRNDRDPETCKEYLTWAFETEDGHRLTIMITEGLRRFEWQEPFPHHAPLYDSGNEEDLGWVTSLQIHGPPVES